MAGRHPNIVAEMRKKLTDARILFGPFKLGDRGSFTTDSTCHVTQGWEPVGSRLWTVGNQAM